MPAKFRPRNSFYLRISKDLVLPVHVYLDEQHVEWMSDQILQHVLSDLRPKILHKLKTETDIHFGLSTAAQNTASSVDTHRGDKYQFCYFLRKIDPHAAVIKRRNFSVTSTSTSNVITKKPRLEKPREKSGNDQDPPSREDQLALDVNEEPEKPKPRLQLRYQGYKIYGHCLCMVIEPWPSNKRTEASKRTPGFNQNSNDLNNVQGKTPLFLPEDLDDDDDSTSVFGASTDTTQHTDPSIEDEYGGMLEFSQALRNAGSMESAGLDEDDDQLSTALFGDADEERELHS